MCSCVGTSGAIPRLATEQAEFFVSESFLAELPVAPASKSGVKYGNDSVECSFYEEFFLQKSENIAPR